MRLKLFTRKFKARLLQDCIVAAQNGESLEDILKRHPRDAGWLHEQLHTLAWLQHGRSLLAPPPDFLLESRERLLDRLRFGLTPSVRLRRRLSGHLYYARLALQAAVLVLLGLLLFNIVGNTALLAQRALPGDLVYPIKQVGERTRLTFAFTPEQEARLHLFYTNQRTLELQELLLEGNVDQAAMAAGLFQDQVLQTKQALDVVARRNPLLAQEMQRQMSASLREQGLVLMLLVDGLPGNMRSGVEQAVLAP